MSVDVNGLDELMSRLEQLGDVGKKVGKKAINEGLKVFLDGMKQDAPIDQDNSRSKLVIQNVKVNKDGAAWGSVGIGKKNWNSTRQLWYQHWGYRNFGWNFDGKLKITNNVGWLDKSYEKSKAAAEQKTTSILKKEIDNLLK